MTLAENVADLLGDQPLLDVVVASVGAVAVAIAGLPVDQRESAQKTAHELLDKMVAEWSEL
jgi:hypothetical protein